MAHHFPPQQQARPDMMAPQQDMLLDRLRSQVEYYFSPQNLGNDSFLRSLLYEGEHVGSVSLEELAKFPKLRQIWAAFRGIREPPLPPADPAFLARALQGSLVVRVSVDGKWISPQPTPLMHQQMRMVPVSYHPQEVLPPANSSVHSAPGSSDGSPPLRSIPSPSSPTSQTTATSSIGVPTHPVKEVPRVVLRNVPEDFSEDQVLNMLSPPEAQVRPKAALRVGDTEWSVPFEAEQEARRAIETLGPDSEIQAEIKTGLSSGVAAFAASGTPPRPELPLAPPPIPQHYQPVPMHPQFHYPVMAYPQGYVPYGVPFAVPPFPPGGPPYGYAMPPPPPPPSGMAGQPYVRYDAQPYPSHVYVRDRGNGGRGIGERGNGGRPGRGQSGRTQQVRGRRQRRSSTGRGDGFTNHEPPTGNPVDRPLPQAKKDDGGGSSQYNHKKKGLRGDEGGKNYYRAKDFTGDGGNNYKANGKNFRGSKQSKQGKMLSEHHFPALADPKPGQAQQSPGATSKAAYAAALLKPMPAASTLSDGIPASPSGEPTSQTQVAIQVGEASAEQQLENAMSKMNVSSGNAAESTDKQDGSPASA